MNATRLSPLPVNGEREEIAEFKKQEPPMTAYKDITVEQEGHVQIVTIRRPPFNFFDNDLIRELAAAFEAGDRDANIRASVLASEGKSFCAGADFANRADTGTVAEGGKHLYKEATRLFKIEKPIIAAVHGDRKSVV